MSWENVESNSGGAGAAYLKLKSGESRKIHIIDNEPFSFKQVFFNTLKKGAIIDPNDNPLEGIKGYDIKGRHALNVFDYEDQTVKILAGSNEMFSSLRAVHQEYGGFEAIDLRILRKGEGLDTKYQIVPAAKCDWTADIAENVTCYDLPEIFKMTPHDVVLGYMEGRDVSKQPQKEETQPEETPSEEIVPEEPLIEEEIAPPVARPVIKTQPVPVKASPMPNRSDIIKSITNAVKTKVKYKDSSKFVQDVQRLFGQAKKSMSQLTTEELVKLYKHVNTVK